MLTSPHGSPARNKINPRQRSPAGWHDTGSHGTRGAAPGGPLRKRSRFTKTALFSKFPSQLKDQRPAETSLCSCPGSAEPLRQKDFAKLRTGKHTARFGSHSSWRRDKRVPSCFGLHPCAGAGIPLHLHIATEPQGSLPATPMTHEQPDPHPRQGQPWMGTALGVLGAIGKPPRARGNS